MLRRPFAAAGSYSYYVLRPPDADKYIVYRVILWSELTKKSNIKKQKEK